ncbi:methyltransferase-like protein [Diaporthe amygdali]|uniref:methyltransferase-like protein n=1 Tax=Phomopsis amygdali TaxID=1214568 RepID=UPI0022FF376E|nr:methyltransferase-like protein [Diaporthe amygdali]KAJ0123706.1 methyltransferase-like protein [Diaporthe amygdali]
MDGKTKLNQEHFDNEAADYDAKHEKTIDEIARRIEARMALIGVEWIEDDSSDAEGDTAPGRAVRVLDYACGTGSMSRAFAPYTTQCVGIDLSEKMVEAYNTRARNQGLSEGEMVAFHGNLCVPEDEDPEAFRDGRFSGFDLAVVGLGFHHFDDPDLAAKRLVARLRPGGVLMIIDFLPHAPHGHDHHHDGTHAHGHGHHGVDSDEGADEKALRTVTHHGFSEERIREVFVGAGAGKDFALDDMGQVKFGEKLGKRTLFMARGTKG